MNTGIVGYGAYVPYRRITVEEIARVWKKDGVRTSKGLKVNEKAVAAFDEDTATIAVEAARRGLEDFGLDAGKLGAIYVGSESHPYAVNPTATILGDALGANPNYQAADLEFACKAGTAGMQACVGLVEAGMIEYGLAVGADTAQGRPGDALEFTAGSGGAAMFIGNKRGEIIAKVNDTSSYSSDTPDFWRRQHAHYPRHGGRFTGKPAYFKHVISAAKTLMKKNKTTADDYDYAVFHQPNGKFPEIAAGTLGFGMEQIEPSLMTPLIGNTYSGSTVVGLAAILDIAKPKQRILAVSYGSGAGSDAFDLTVTSAIKKRRARVPVKQLIKHKRYIDYATYAKHRKKIRSL